MKGQRGNQLLENNELLAHLQSCHEQSIHIHIRILYAIHKNTLYSFREHLFLHSLFPLLSARGEEGRFDRNPLMPQVNLIKL